MSKGGVRSLGWHKNKQEAPRAGRISKKKGLEQPHPVRLESSGLAPALQGKARSM